MTATERSRPTLMTRLAAAMHGEIAATTVEAYRRAGAAAYQDMLDAEQLRVSLAASGGSLWTTRPHQASQLLCAWNAFALQTLGDQLVEADYQADSRTVGYLPRVTAEQAAAFLGEVGHWSAQARRAASDETYDVTAEFAVPAPLPYWVEVEPCPPAHLAAMLAAARAMRGRAEAALADLVKATAPKGKAGAASRLRGLAAEADSVTSFGESLWSPGATGEIHEKVENSLRRGIAAYYQLGQLLAMPDLLEEPEITASRFNGTRLPLPGQPGFDPWCLTDPDSRSTWQDDPAACRAIEMLWLYDPNPAATLVIQSQIDASAADGSIVLGATVSNEASHYFCCPWAAIYTVRRPVIIADQYLRPMQQFTFDVSAEEMAEGGEFVRRLLPGPFHPTDEVDYCDPTAGE
jgi:hypothetical protein